MLQNPKLVVPPAVALLLVYTLVSTVCQHAYYRSTDCRCLTTGLHICYTFPAQGSCIACNSHALLSFLKRDCIPAYTLFKGSHGRNIGSVYTTGIMRNSLCLILFLTVFV